MAYHCRACQAELLPFEVNAVGGGRLLIRPSEACAAAMEEDENFDTTAPAWMGRYLDGYPCVACGTNEFAAHDLAALLEVERGYLPDSDRPCEACGGVCKGLLPLECDGAGSTPLAFLDHKFGAPLGARMCAACGRVVLSLYPDDTEARAELAKRFPDAGPCPRCSTGRLRETRIDAPHCGLIGLFEGAPATAGNPYGVSKLAFDLGLVVCDSCGEATTRPDPGRD